MISFIEAFQKELASEAPATRRMLALVPADKMDWQPHPKSMTIRHLATHLADIASWFPVMLNQSDWDMAADSETDSCENTEALLKKFDDGVQQSQTAFSQATDAVLEERWVLRAGDQVYMDMPRWEAIRHAFGQNAHHRAQLGVYLRLLDIAVPGPYGPSADEMEAMAVVEEKV